MLPEVISAWHDAVNRRDLDAARRTVTDPVDVRGPRGAGPISADAFTEWILSSGITLEPVAAHPVDATTVVVEQDATWPQSTAATRVATVFQIRDGAVSRIHRFDSLAEALDGV
jgi:hypothetical protein